MNRLELKNKDGAYGVGGMGDNEEDEERLEEDAFRQVMQTASAPGKVISEQVRSSTAAMVATADETEAEGSASRLDTLQTTQVVDARCTLDLTAESTGSRVAWYYLRRAERLPPIAASRSVPDNGNCAGFKYH